MINVYYWIRTNNFGDMLSPIVVRYISKGQKINLVGRNYNGKLLAIGSILGALRERDIVWGAGSIKQCVIFPPKEVKFLAVRGPLTRKLIQGDCSEIYGDPSMLLPYIVCCNVKKKYSVSLMPHEVDKKIMCIPIVHFIDINKDPLIVIKEIKESKLVITSSLHGVIVSEAYNVPVVWVKASDKIIGGSFKFNDYFLSTNRDYKQPEQWGKKLSLYKPIERYKSFDLEPLKKAWCDYANKPK